MIAASADTIAALREQTKMLGATPSPMDTWLSLRGIKTLPLRFERQCRAAAEIAATLADDPRIDRVLYPSTDNPGGQFRSDLRGALEMIVPATTLGDVYSLVLYPAMASHRALTPDERVKVGISENLLRLSIGIEEPKDILSDLSRALDAATA